MLIDEVILGTYDVTFKFRKKDQDKLVLLGLWDNPAVNSSEYPDLVFGQEILVVRREEFSPSKVVKILITHGIEADIELSPFYFGDAVERNMYVRRVEGGMRCFSNLKLNFEIALNMTKLLKEMEDAGITGVRAAIQKNISQFHSISFLVCPLDQTE